MRLLVGDLGGTHTRLALAELDGGPIRLQRVTRSLNQEHADLSAILVSFASDLPDNCCLAVAGPTDGQRVRFTNLDWQIDTAQLSQRFGFSHCRLINDFSAVGWGLNGLADTDLAPLQAGQPKVGGPRVALGAGTGFGVSLCTWQDRHYQPQASEGGHVGFAPVTPEQDRLLGFLRERYGRVSVERILSGPGLVDLYRFSLMQRGECNDTLLQQASPAAAISQAGLEQRDAAAIQALRLFVEIYGQTAGDWALSCQASGGIFLAGGIAPKLLPALSDGAFLNGFLAKGRYSEWMQQVPVSVILDPDIGLKGAGFAAVQSA